MKKSLLALAVLASAAGAANAASSVTLYGRVDVGYEDFSGDGRSVVQAGNGDTRLGIKGQEDLGNGLAATFQLEGNFNADTGSKTATNFFNRESTVGLKGNFGHVRFGRSKSAMERSLGDYNPGERVGALWDPYTSATRHSNGMFYDYDMNGFNFGFDVTTKGGIDGSVTDLTTGLATSVEGVSGTKPSFGVHASYNGTINANNSYSIAAAYQQDGLTVSNNSVLSTGKSKEWGVGAQYNYKQFGIGGSYADWKMSDVKLRSWGAYVTAAVTPNDALYAKYMSKKGKYLGTTWAKDDMFGIGYSHALSKRTSVYADVARYRNRMDGGSSSTGYDIALRHAF